MFRFNTYSVYTLNTKLVQNRPMDSVNYTFCPERPVSPHTCD